ncbi:MAG: hypothetical protein WAX20_03665 [Enterococcus aquimarinus]
MKYTINDIELQTLLEAMKLVNLEKQVLIKDDEIDIPEAVVAGAMKSIEERILYLLRSDSSANAKSIFENFIQGKLESEKFLQIAQSILDRCRFIEVEANDAQKIRLSEETPEPILHIMQHLAAYGNGLNDLLGSNFYNQYFLSQYLVYRVNEDKFMFDSKKINKTELHELVYGTSEILEKMTDVQNAHSSLFKGDPAKISLDTAKKRMQQVLPSKHKEGTMNQSEELNVFQQQALLGILLIYKTSYQRFLSNPATQRVPDTRTFNEMKAVIEEFYQKQPISGIDDALFLKTVSEDTYHFALFNAFTRLTTAVLKEVNEIIVASRKYDTLSMLFIIDQMIDSMPAYTSEWLSKYQEMVSEIDKFAKYPEIQQTVLSALDDEEALNYAKQTMLNMFGKFDNLQQDSENYDFMEEVFKKIVSDYYNDDETKSAYAK